MNILFFYPSNRRTIPIDIPLFELQKRGHQLFLVTTADFGAIHDLYSSHSARVFSTKIDIKNRLLRFAGNLIFLLKFCKKHKIDQVHSHLQQANLIAVVAQFFIKSRVVIFRHHCKFDFLVSETFEISLRERVADKIINSLSKKIIVPSKAVADVMQRLENVDASKVSIIPYVYDLDKMADVNTEFVAQVRREYDCELMVIMVSRLTKFKRHMTALNALASLIRKRMDIQVLIMDDGPEEEAIRNFVATNKLTESIHLLGFKENIMDYIKAADVIIHPSLTEASNSAIKEAGLLEKIVLTCDGVGDFNDYIITEVNGFLLSPERFTSEAEALLESIYNNKKDYLILGSKLKSSVMQKFALNNQIIDLYESL